MKRKLKLLQGNVFNQFFSAILEILARMPNPILDSKKIDSKREEYEL